MWKIRKRCFKDNGAILAIRHYHDGSYSIGNPNAMFCYDPNCPMHVRRVCSLFGIDEETLAKLVYEANHRPNEFIFLTLRKKESSIFLSKRANGF